MPPTNTIEIAVRVKDEASAALASIGSRSQAVAARAGAGGGGSPIGSSSAGGRSQARNFSDQLNTQDLSAWVSANTSARSAAAGAAEYARAAGTSGEASKMMAARLLDLAAPGAGAFVELGARAVESAGKLNGLTTAFSTLGNSIASVSGIAAAAFLGWEIGKMIGDKSGLNDVVGDRAAAAEEAKSPTQLEREKATWNKRYGEGGKNQAGLTLEEWQQRNVKVKDRNDSGVTRAAENDKAFAAATAAELSPEERAKKILDARNAAGETYTQAQATAVVENERRKDRAAAAEKERAQAATAAGDDIARQNEEAALRASSEANYRRRNRAPTRADLADAYDARARAEGEINARVQLARNATGQDAGAAKQIGLTAARERAEADREYASAVRKSDETTAKDRTEINRKLQNDLNQVTMTATDFRIAEIKRERDEAIKSGANRALAEKTAQAQIAAVTKAAAKDQADKLKVEWTSVIGDLDAVVAKIRGKERMSSTERNRAERDTKREADENRRADEHIRSRAARAQERLNNGQDVSRRGMDAIQQRRALDAPRGGGDSPEARILSDIKTLLENRTFKAAV